MRSLVFAAVIGLSACAAAPRPACGCLPSVQPDMPLPTMSAAEEAAVVTDALEFACLKEKEPTVFVRGAVQAGWLKQGAVPEGTQDCAIEVTGPAGRIAAVDAALVAWAERRGLTWNVRDADGFWDEGRRTVRRTRGEHGQGEGELSWRIVEFEDVTHERGLRLEWSPPRD